MGSLDGKLVRGSIGVKRTLAEPIWWDSCWRQARVIRHHLGVGGGWATLSDIEGDQISRMGGSGQTELAGFLLKLDSTRKCTNGSRKSFRNLTKVWMSSKSLPGEFIVLGTLDCRGEGKSEMLEMQISSLKWHALCIPPPSPHPAYKMPNIVPSLCRYLINMLNFIYPSSTYVIWRFDIPCILCINRTPLGQH